MKDPVYFGMIDFAFLSKEVFMLPYNVTLVSFSESDLSNPDSDPICMYYQHGNRLYLWKDKVWTECLVSSEALISRCRTLINNMTNSGNDKSIGELNKTIDMLLLYQNSPSPSSEPKVFHRVIVSA